MTFEQMARRIKLAAFDMDRFVAAGGTGSDLDRIRNDLRAVIAELDDAIALTEEASR